MKLFSTILFSFVLFTSTMLLGQANGDYRSVASGNWDAIATWQTYDLPTTSWVAAVVKPGATNNVWVQATHTISLTMNEACNDIHLASAAAPNYGRVATVTFTLEVNGKIRLFTGAIPGTNVSSPVNPPFTKSAAGSLGLVKIVGNTRIVLNTGEFGSFTANAPSTTGSIEVAMNSNQTATFQTGAKFASWVISSGTLNMTGRLAVDFGTTTLGNVSVSTGATFISNQSGTIMSRTGSGVGGVFTLDGTMILTRPSANIGMTTLNFNGTVKYDTLISQTLLTALTGGAVPNVYNNLEIAGSDTKTLSYNTTVNGNLTLTGGLLTLRSFNLILSSSASVSGSPSVTNMVVVDGSGELRKEFSGPGSFIYPVGDTTQTDEYSPVTLNFTSGSFTSAYTGVKIVNAQHPFPMTPPTHYINRYWIVNSSGISSFSCDATFKYVDADINLGGNENLIYLHKYDNPVWSTLNITNTGTNELTGTVTNFSDFWGADIAAAPVELSSFNVNTKNGIVQLSWRTTTETNSSKFEVERKSANNNWMKVGEVAASGNSNSPKDYSFADKNLTVGKYQYRIKMVDADGSYEYSSAVEADISQPTEFSLLQNYPNPFNPTTRIEYQIPVDSKVTIELYGISGEKIGTLVNSNLSAGYYSVDINSSSLNLASGIYLYKMTAYDVNNQSFSQVKKLILSK